MQVVYHHRTMGRSSQGMHIRSLVEAFRAEGHEVRIVSLPGIDPRQTAGVMPFLREDDPAHGINRLWKNISRKCPQFVFELLELLYNLFIPFRLLPVLKQQTSAFLYERHAYFMFMGVLLGKLTRRQVVLEVNELPGFKRARGLVMKRLALKIDRHIFSWADHILCVSSVLAEEAKRRGAKVDRVHVVPNAIDPKRFQSLGYGKLVRKRFDLCDSVVVGHVGLFYPWDRLDVLIKIVKDIRESHPEVKILLVGDGPEMEKLRQMATEFGMSDTLVFSGPVKREEVAAYIDAMDICVLPDSNDFGSPIALFEFMAMGKPVVVPDLGPMRDVVAHKLTGLIFPHADYDALKETLLRLIEDANLRRTVGDAAKRTALKRHTWTENARFTIRLVSDSNELGNLSSSHPGIKELKGGRTT